MTKLTLPKEMSTARQAHRIPAEGIAADRPPLTATGLCILTLQDLPLDQLPARPRLVPLPQPRAGYPKTTATANS